MRAQTYRLLFSVTLLLCMGPAIHVAASQDAATPLAELGYPELEAVVSGNGVSDIPDELEAGRYRIVVTSDVEMQGNATVVYIPEDVTEDEALAAVRSESGPPDWYYTTAMPAALLLGGDGTSEIIADLPPGRFLFVVFVWEGEVDPGAPQLVTVTGDTSGIASAPVPAAEVELQLADMSFTLSGAVPAGTSTWQITNNGPQPHEVTIVKAPDGTTRDQVLAINEAAMTGGTPPPDGPNPEEFMPMSGVAPISSGTTVWTALDLEPGTYVLVCYVTDPETGMPHMTLGMIDVFTVE